MSRTGRVQPRAAAVAALLAVSAGCADVDVVTPAGATVVRGALRLRPVRFATEDYYLRPSVVDAEEGWLDVPAVRGRGDGGESATVVRIHWVRLPATTRTKGAPIVYLAGGPGGSGVRSAAGDRFPLFDALRETGDVIALDQRGAYGADPTAACPGRWSYPLDRPLDPATLARVMAPYLRRCAAY